MSWQAKQLEIRVDHRLQTVLRLNLAQCAFGEPPPQELVIGKPRQRFCDGIGILGRHEDSRILGEHRGNATHGGGDARQARGHRFDQCHRQTLRSRSHHERVGTVQELMHVRALSEKGDGCREILRSPYQLQGRTLGSVTGQEHADCSATVLSQSRRCLQQRMQTLDRFEPTHVEANERRIVNSQRGAHAAARFCVGRECRHAVRKDAQSICGHTHALVKIVGDSRMDPGDGRGILTAACRPSQVFGLLVQLESVVLGHHDVLDARITGGEPAKRERHRMLDVQSANAPALEEPVQLERIGGPTYDRWASQIIQIDAFDAMRFQMIPERTRGAVESEAHHAVSPGRVFDAQLRAYPFGTARTERIEALCDDRAIGRDVRAFRQNPGPIVGYGLPIVGYGFPVTIIASRTLRRAANGSMNVKRLRSSSPALPESKDHPESAKPDPLRNLSWAAYLYIAFTVGRVLNVVPVLSSLPLVKVLLVYITFALIGHWKTLPKLTTVANPAVKWWIAFVVSIVLSVTYSTWFSASRNFVIFQLPVLIVLVLVICKLSGEWKSLRNLFFAQFVSAMVLVVASLRTYTGGRLDVDVLGDTNELAYMFDGVIPIALAFGMTTASKKHRLFFYGTVAVMSLAVVLTGSRGGEFGLLAVAAFAVLAPTTLSERLAKATRLASAPKRRMGPIGRLVVCAGAVTVVGVAVWPHLPQVPRERLASILSLGSDYNVDEKEGRVKIWKRGLNAYAERPIGYGIATYPMVDWKHGGLFFTAHNILVLILVEVGPVGLLTYLGMMLYLWLGLARMHRKLGRLEMPSEEQRQQAVFCRMSQAALIGNFVAGQFLSATYYYGHWASIALAMSLIALPDNENPGSSLEPDRAFKPKRLGKLEHARSIDRGRDVGHRPDQAPDDVRRPRPPGRRRPAGGGPVTGDHRTR